MPRVFAAAVTAAVLAATATPARAADPVKMGAGRMPTLAVAPDGTGHMAWVNKDNKIVYCRLPAGATSCSVTKLLPIAAAATETPYVTRLFVFAPAVNELVIVAGCDGCNGNNRVIRWILAPYDDYVDIADPYPGFSLREGGGVWVDDATAKKSFIGASPSGIVRSLQHGFSGGAKVSTFTYTPYPGLVRVPGTMMLVHAAVGSKDGGPFSSAYSVYAGPSFSTGDLNNLDGPYWSAPKDLVAPSVPIGSLNLNAGPSGVFAMSAITDSDGNPHLAQQRFNPATRTFSAPAYVAGEDHIDDQLWGTVTKEDGAGRIHALWRSGYDDGRLRYTVSDTTGTHFAPAGTLAKRDQFDWAELAAGPDGHGWATYTADGISPIWLVPLDPQAEKIPVAVTPAVTPVPVPKAVTPKATPVPKAPVKTPTKIPVPKWPPTPHPSTQVAGGTLHLSAASGCVKRGVRFTASLALRRGTGEIRRVEFWVDGVRVKIDRRAPFRQRLSTTRLFVGDHVVMTRATVKLRHGQMRPALWTTVRVCA